MFQTIDLGYYVPSGQVPLAQTLLARIERAGRTGAEIADARSRPVLELLLVGGLIAHNGINHWYKAWS